MKNNNKNKECSHCGSLDTLPIQYGLMTNESIEENAKDRKWAWGGCVMYIGGDTDYCNNCNNNFGAIKAQEKTSKSESYDSEKFLQNREKLLDILDKYLDEEKDETMYAKALKEAGGDKIEAEHIYFSLFMDSNYYD